MEILKQNGNICIGKIEINVGDSGHITNCYVVYDKQDMSGILFDPADKAEYILQELEDNDISLKAICITHCHSDHIGALEDIYKLYLDRGIKIKVYIHKNDKAGLIDDDKNYTSMLGLKSISTEDMDIIELQEGDRIKEGKIDLEVIHTPGHTDGCIMFVEPILNAMVTGDTIFSDCYGRVDLKSGSIDEMNKSIDKIFDRFNNIDIYPGHGEVAVLSEIKKRIRMLLKIRR